MADHPEQFDTIIIGSGMGGMTTARLLQEMRGDRVLVLERHSISGGMTHEFTRQSGDTEYAFSTGLHYLGEEKGPLSPRVLIDYLTGGTVQWSKLPDSFDVFLTPTERFDLPSTFEALSNRLVDRFPEEEDAIRQYYFSMIPTAARQLIRLNIANSLPPLLRRQVFPLAKRFCTLALTTTQKVIDDQFKNPDLKSILAFQWGDYGRSPKYTAFGIHARIMAHYEGGAIYPVGGSMRIARKTAAMIERRGGELRTSHVVQSVLIEQGRAVGVDVRDLETGRQYQIRANAVVSSAGAKNTYQRLLPTEYSEQALKSLDSLGSTISAVILFVGFKESPQTLGFDGANYWAFKDGDHASAEEALPGEGPLYFSFASLKNPASRSHTAEIVSLCDLSPFEKWASLKPPHNDPDYQAAKVGITKRILERAESLFPGFGYLVDFVELATPLTFKTYQNSVDGAFYGLPASVDRLINPYAVPRTPIKGLYLAGQDAVCPGIVGAAAGGARSVGIMLGTDRTPAVFKELLKGASVSPVEPWNGFLRVALVKDETSTVKSFYLETLDGAALPFQWQAGQYLNVFVPTPGNTTVRSYSISSAANQFNDQFVRLTIKQEPGGQGSTFMHEALSVGDLIEVSGPHGDFTYQKGKETGLVLIGGGVGVTPLMAVLEQLVAEKSTLPIKAVFAFRDETQIIFAERLHQLASDMPNLDVTLVLSQPSRPDWNGETGYIRQPLLHRICPDIADHRVHLCGPAPMMDQVTKTLADLGVAADAIHTESFGAATPKAEDKTSKPFSIHFKKTGKSATGRIGDTILDVALREKIVIPHVCGIGTCGTCRMRVISGDFEAPPTDLISAQDISQGFVLACKARPQTDIELDI